MDCLLPAADCLLIFARTLGLAWMAPGWGTPSLGWQFRVLLAVLLAGVLVPAVGPGFQAPGGPAELGRWCLAEAAVGAVLGLSAAVIVGGARQAGELVAAQAGLSAAALFDPEAGAELTPLGHLYGLIALGTFLALDGPLALVGALAESYQAVPAGGLSLSAEAVAATFGRVGQALELTLRAAAPAALALALAGLALGLLGRAAAALQLWTLSLPIRAAVGLVLVLLGLMTLAATLTAGWTDLPALDVVLPG
ncbi:MAG TPA: flagellar biosynthetic protein FliR [Isosphaeraceae bacterium]|jgi:flagellar biosynthesis protein FliR